MSACGTQRTFVFWALLTQHFLALAVCDFRCRRRFHRTSRSQAVNSSKHKPTFRRNHDRLSWSGRNGLLQSQLLPAQHFLALAAGLSLRCSGRRQSSHRSPSSSGISDGPLAARSSYQRVADKPDLCSCGPYWRNMALGMQKISSRNAAHLIQEIIARRDVQRSESILAPQSDRTMSALAASAIGPYCRNAFSTLIEENGT